MLQKLNKEYQNNSLRDAQILQNKKVLNSGCKYSSDVQINVTSCYNKLIRWFKFTDPTFCHDYVFLYPIYKLENLQQVRTIHHRQIIIHRLISISKQSSYCSSTKVMQRTCCTSITQQSPRKRKGQFNQLSSILSPTTNPRSSLQASKLQRSCGFCI